MLLLLFFVISGQVLSRVKPSATDTDIDALLAQVESLQLVRQKVEEAKAFEAKLPAGLHLYPYKTPNAAGGSKPLQEGQTPGSAAHLARKVNTKDKELVVLDASDKQASSCGSREAAASEGFRTATSSSFCEHHAEHEKAGEPVLAGEKIFDKGVHVKSLRLPKAAPGGDAPRG